MTPAYGRAKAGRPARTYIQQLCEDTGCSPEDLPEAMNDREKWRERIRDIRASSTTWWWWIFSHKNLFLSYIVCYEQPLTKLAYKNISSTSNDKENTYLYFLNDSRELATLVGGEPKSLFSIATTPKCRGGCFPGLLHFTLDPYVIMLSVKQGNIKYHFLSLWYDATKDWTPFSRTIGKHSTH